MKQVKLLIILLPVLILALFLPQAVLAETKNLAVTKDTYANSGETPNDYTDNNYGSTGSVVISNKYVTRLGFLQFENPDLPEGAIVDQGTLKFWVHELHYADTAKVNVGPITGDWEEQVLTWDNKPTINQTQAIESEIALDTAGWREIPITHLVRQWHEGTSENKGIFIYPLGYLYGTAETEYAFSFKTKESVDNPAIIEVEYHLEEEPTASPTVGASPTTAPPAETSPEPTEEATAFPESETPTPEEEAKEATKEAEGTVLSLTTGQTIIAGLIILALVGSLVAFAVYFARQSKGDKKDKQVKKEKKEKKNDES